MSNPPAALVAGGLLLLAIGVALPNAAAAQGRDQGDRLQAAGAGVAGVPALAAVAPPAPAGIERARAALLDLERVASAAAALGADWDGARVAWRRRVDAAGDVPALGALLVELDGAVSPRRHLPIWRAWHSGWARRVGSAATEDELLAGVVVLLSAAPGLASEPGGESLRRLASAGIAPALDAYAFDVAVEVRRGPRTVRARNVGLAIDRRCDAPCALRLLPGSYEFSHEAGTIRREAGGEGRLVFRTSAGGVRAPGGALIALGVLVGLGGAIVAPIGFGHGLWSMGALGLGVLGAGVGIGIAGGALVRYGGAMTVYEDRPVEPPRASAGANAGLAPFPGVGLHLGGVL